MANITERDCLMQFDQPIPVYIDRSRETEEKKKSILEEKTVSLACMTIGTCITIGSGIGWWIAKPTPLAICLLGASTLTGTFFLCVATCATVAYCASVARS